MLKLNFIGEKVKDTFKVDNLGTCRIFYEMYFGSIDDIKKYLIPMPIPLSLNASKYLQNKGEVLFACADTKKLYYGTITKLYEFSIKLYEKDKNNTIISEVKENPIPIDVIINTKDNDIVNMLKKRGCKILVDKKEGYLITPTPILLYNKKFLDNLELKSFPKVEKEIITTTGKEQLLKLNIYNSDTKKTTLCKGKSVYTIKEDKLYVIFNYNGIDTYYEVWYENILDKDGFPKDKKILNDWNKENRSKLKGKNQSNRIYIWQV